MQRLRWFWQASATLLLMALVLATPAQAQTPRPVPPPGTRVTDLTGTLISLLPVTDETVCQAHVNLAEGKLLRLDTNKDLLPPEGTEVKLIMQAK